MAEDQCGERQDQQAVTSEVSIRRQVSFRVRTDLQLHDEAELLAQPDPGPDGPEISNYACSDLSFDGVPMVGAPLPGAADIGLPEETPVAPQGSAYAAGRDGDIAATKSSSAHSVRSTVIQIEEANDFPRGQFHKYTTVRPAAAVTDHWSFERRLVTTKASPTGVKVDWVSSKTENAAIAADGPVENAEITKGSTAAMTGASRDQDNAGERAAVVVAKAVHSRINVLASTTRQSTMAATNASTTESQHSGSSVIILNPKDSYVDVSIRVKACGGKSADGKEDFKIHVAPSRSRDSIHLEGHVMTPASSKTDLVHDFKIAAVPTVHHVKDPVVTPDEDPDYPPHSKLLPSVEAAATTEQSRAKTKSQKSATEELPAAKEVPVPKDRISHKDLSAQIDFPVPKKVSTPKYLPPPKKISAPKDLPAVKEVLAPKDLKAHKEFQPLIEVPTSKNLPPHKDLITSKEVPAPKDLQAHKDPSPPKELPASKDLPAHKDLPASKEVSAPKNLQAHKDPSPPKELPASKDLPAHKDLPASKEVSAAKNLQAHKQPSPPKEVAASKNLPANKGLPAPEEVSEPKDLQAHKDHSALQELPTSKELPAHRDLPASKEVSAPKNLQAHKEPSPPKGVATSKNLPANKDFPALKEVSAPKDLQAHKDSSPLMGVLARKSHPTHKDFPVAKEVPTPKTVSAPKDLSAPKEPLGTKGNPYEPALPLQIQVERENITGRETFRAAVVPVANNVPVLGSITRVTSSVRMAEDGGLSSLCGFGDNRSGGPFQPELSADEFEEPSNTAMASCTHRALRGSNVVQCVASTENLESIRRAKSELKEEFLFSATMVGLTENDRRDLPPVRASSTTSPRVHLRPTNQLSEFGFSATTFGITDIENGDVASRQSLNKRPSASRLSCVQLCPTKRLSEFGFSATTIGLTDADRRVIASSPSLNKRPSTSHSSRVHLPPTKRLTEFGFSATTIGLTDKDHSAVASSQSLDKRAEIKSSKSRLLDLNMSSKDLRGRDCHMPGREAETESRRSATTVLADRGVKNLSPSRERFRVSDGQSSGTVTGVAERISEEFLPITHVSRSTARSSRLVEGLPSQIIEGFLGQELTEKEYKQSSRCVFGNDQDAEIGVTGMRNLDVSTERLYNTKRLALSIIDEEDSTTDVNVDGVTRKRALQTLQVTPSRVLFSSVEGSSTFENSNPATYNSSNQPGQPIGSFYEERLINEQNSVGASLEPPRDRPCSVRFVDDISVPQWVPDVAENLPSVEFQGHKGPSATTFPSARSMIDFQTAYDTAHNSSEPQSPLSMYGTSRLGTLSVSSSSSLETNGLKFNQEAQLSVVPGTTTEHTSVFKIPAADMMLRDTGDYFGPDIGRKECDPSVVTGNQLNLNEDGCDSLQDQQYPLGLHSSMTARRTGSAELAMRPPYYGQYGQQTGAEGWLPYEQYCEPPMYRELGAFQAKFKPLKPLLRVPYPRTPGAQAIVAPANGGIHRMTPLVRRRSPEFAHWQVPYGRMRLSTAGATRKVRRGDGAYPQQDVPCAGPRATISMQQDIGVGQAYGPRSTSRARRSVSPGRMTARVLQQRSYSPPGLQDTHWGNTYAPSMVNSWHGGYENPAFEPLEQPMPPPFTSTMPAPSPTIDGRSWWTPYQEYRVKRKKAVFLEDSVSTFESHENLKEPRAPRVRSPRVLKKLPPEEKITSTKTVQTEERGGISRAETATSNAGRPKIITPRVKTHVDVDDSNSEMISASYTRARTHTEMVQQPCVPGGNAQPPDFARSPDQPSFFSPSSGSPSSPHPGYINQNFVCPPYMTNFRPDVGATPSVPVPVAAPFLAQQMAQVTPPAAAQMTYYGQLQAVAPLPVPQPPASTPAAPARSSSDRVASCPLSSCFRGASSRPEKSSEGVRVKECDGAESKECDHHCSHRKRRHRRSVRSPLPPPSAGSTFTVGYMMNSENELSPIFMPLNDKQPRTNETTAAYSPPSPSAHVDSSPGSASEDDPVAKLEKRVQEQMVEIEKAIKEQDARREENAMKKRKEKRNERKEAPKKRIVTPAKRGDPRLRKIFVAKAEDESSTEEFESEPQSWFSWSRTSKPRKGVQLKVPQGVRPVSSTDSQTAGSSASQALSKDKYSEGSEKIAILGVSSSEAPTPSGFAWAARRERSAKISSRSKPYSNARHSGFIWATRKKPDQSGSRGSPGSDTKRTGFTWATRKKKHYQSSQRGSASREAVFREFSLESYPRQSIPRGSPSNEGVPHELSSEAHRRKSSPHGSPSREAAAHEFLSKSRRRQPSPRGSPAKVPLCSRFSPETHQKKPSVEPSPRGSPEKEPTRPAFTMKLHRNKSTESSPRGSPVRKVYYADNESGMSENHSRGGSPQRKSEKRAPSPRSSPKCSGRSSPTTDKSRQKRQPKERSVDEAHTDTDSPLLAKIRVGFPGARRTQRRWSRTEMHRSTSYDTAASSLAPSSTKEKRAHSAGQFPSAKPPRAHKKTSVETISEDPPASWWQSMCNIFGGAEPQPATEKAVGTKKSCCDSVCDLCRSWCSDEPKPRKKSSPRRRSSAGFPSPQPVLPPPPPPPVLPLPPVNPPQRSGYPPMPPKPEFRRRQGSSEDVATEKNKPVETKPSTGGSILSNIFNWFSSRSGEKQDETKVKDVGSGIQGSSFQQWLAAKECALKRDENKHSGELIGLAGKGSPERHNAGSRDGSRKRSRERLPSQEASPVPRELYFEEEGGPRWVIKYSPSPSVTPGQPAVDGPRLHKSTRSRERTPPVLGTQCPPGAAETDWSVQYLYGPGGYKQGSPAPSGSRSPMRMPAPPPSLAIRFQGMHGQYGTGQAMTTTGFSGPSPRGFNNAPDFSIRIKQGRERSSSSRASIRSKGPGRETSLAGSKEEPSLILRLVQPRSRSRGSSIQSQEHSNGPEKKKSEVTFKDKVETKVIASPPTEPPVGKPAKTEHPPPADTATAPPAPPPITPRILRTEETFKHEFFEEMDERGKAATMAPAVGHAGGVSTEATAQSVSQQMAAINALLAHDAQQSKASETLATASVPKKPSPSSAPHTEEKKRSHAGSSKEKPAQMPPDHVGEAQTPALLTSHSDPAGKKAHKPPKSSESPKPSAGGKKASLSPGEPAHTNYVLEMKRHREHVPYWSDPLSYKCPTVQEVAGYAIITAVLLLGLVLLVSVPRLRSQAPNSEG